MKITFSTVITILITCALFLGAEMIAISYTHEISSFMADYKILGPVFFVIMAMVAVLLPVWSNIFLLPIGVVCWGPFVTAVLCIIGWLLGSITAFFIGRTYQGWLLRTYPSFKKYRIIDSYIPKNHTLASLIFLRMTMPVDVLSYALGLFSTHISWKQNAVTTLIGITPFAFIFSYIGLFSFGIQGIIFGSTVVAFLVFIIIQKKRISVVSKK